MRPSLFRTLFFVVVAGVSFILIDSVLANTERRETALEAARFYRDGQRLMQQDKYADAAGAFRSAIANARGNGDYPLALGQALLDEGRLDEAEATLTDLLKTNSMAGAPNLAIARVFAKEDRFGEAAFSYHRAIYGQWPGNMEAGQLEARFELAGFLAARNSKAELLAELLPLQEQAPGDVATQEKIARMYMTAGSPARAAAIFHDLARANPQDPRAHEGVGEAEFASGDYIAAQAGFIAVVRLDPAGQEARKRLELTDQVLNLDPMRAGVSGWERYERSLHVLQLVADRIGTCLTPAQANSFANLVNAAQAALKGHVQPADQSDAVEANLALANKLWHAESSTCKSVSAADQPLQLVLAKAAKAAQAAQNVP